MSGAATTMSAGSPRRAFRGSIGRIRSAAVTVVAVAIAASALVPFVRWALIDARWTGTARDCRAEGVGACWAFIGHKLPFILFGLYPPSDRWRPALATIVIIGLVIVTMIPIFWRRRLIIWWIAALALALWLLSGGASLQHVPTQQWGGLPITLMLTVIGLGAGLPIGILLALGRRSQLPLPRLTATAVVEVVRGVPLVAVLYLSVLVVPLALSTGVEIDKLFLAQAGVALFAGAYLAEAVRGGLQMVPARRMDAARALGLSWWEATRLVVLPEAMRIVLPAFISIAVGFLQDTSLIVIIGLFDLLNTARLAAQDPAWLGFHTEAYVFVGLVYFAASALVSRYGLWLEHRLATSTRRM
jgi:general L-amino acid transport system permease protein